MEVRSSASPLDVRFTTRRLARSMLSPLCGLDRLIGFTLRGYREPRFVTSGADLTGVHVLRGTQAPPTGFYHIGGGGVLLEEALIRTLGETVERYCQMVAEVAGRHPIVHATYDEMLARGEPIIGCEHLGFFTAEQYRTDRFPFRPFSRSARMGWVAARSLITGARTWLPAQLVLVGYTPKVHDGEDWLLAAVTTGTAAHTDPRAAVLNALLELVQIDSAMGHWYAQGRAELIEHDGRTTAIQRVVERHFFPHTPQPSFYFLHNADLPGTTVACVIKDGEGGFPALAVGLGASFRLVDAMYKALLEAVGVGQLAKFQLMQRSAKGESDNEIDRRRIFDLDTSVPYYALPPRKPIVDTKFPDHRRVAARSLPADDEEGAAAQIRRLVAGFARTGKDLFILDLTAEDVAQLGFTVARLWSPDTISLCLPSAPPMGHRRFRAYGAAEGDWPHPYP